MTAIRLVLVGDNCLLRDGLAAMLERRQGIAVVAVADGQEDALAPALVGVEADVVLIDRAMRDDQVFRCIAALRARLRHVAVLVVNQQPAQGAIVELVRLGVSGFLASDADLDELVNAVREVAAGGHVLSTRLAGALFAQIAEPAARSRRASAAALTPMTRREREIAQLVCDGLTNKEIAQRLNIATFTVKSHIHNMLGKFALQGRLQLAARVSVVASDRAVLRKLNGY